MILLHDPIHFYSGYLFIRSTSSITHSLTLENIELQGYYGQIGGQIAINSSIMPFPLFQWNIQINCWYKLEKKQQNIVLTFMKSWINKTLSDIQYANRNNNQFTMIYRSLFKFSNVKSFGVIGCGQMGTGIAIVANRVAKLPVLIYDSNPVSLKKSQTFVSDWLSKQLTKKRITPEQITQFNSRLSFTDEIDGFKSRDVDFVVEAIVQNLNVKQSVLSAIDRILKPEAIIASNTSSISISKLANSTKRPDRVIGMHFMNPVPVMKLVEVIRALQTSDKTHQITQKLAHQMAKQTSTSKDIPGFIANRLLMPYINEAIFALYEGIGSKQDIDKTMKLGTNVPMGPLTLADFIGLDTCLSIMEVLHRDLGDSKYRPCPLLVNYVDAGYLGIKSGRGFYEYKPKK